MANFVLFMFYHSLKKEEKQGLWKDRHGFDSQFDHCQAVWRISEPAQGRAYQPLPGFI